MKIGSLKTLFVSKGERKDFSGIVALTYGNRIIKGKANGHMHNDYLKKGK